ncbi:MAG TPA: hypothetical protein VGK73_36205, partial [Polyangiaceae bacterium]
MFARGSLPVLLAALLVGAASCGISQSKHACASDGDCLEGRVCESGLCRLPNDCGGAAACNLGGATSGAGSDDGGAAGESERPAGGGRGAASAGATSGQSGSSSGGNAGRGGKNGTNGGSGGGEVGGAGQSGAMDGGGTSSNAGSAGTNGATNGGTSGNASGESGGSGSMTTAGGGGSTGAAGSEAAGTGGTHPPPRCDPYSVSPECHAGERRYLLTPAADAVAVVGMSIGDHTGFHVFASKRDRDSVVVSFTHDRDGRDFYDFSCFDSVPAPKRAAGARLQDGQPEVFMLGRCGRIHQRNIFTTSETFGWTAWAPFQMPWNDSEATDVATSLGPEDQNIVYLVDRGTVYFRYRRAEDRASYGDWFEAKRGAGPILAAGLRPDERQQLFTFDGEGRPATSIQTTENLNAPFGAWEDFGSASVPPLVDLECVYGQQSLELFALDETGLIWSRRQDESGAFTPWDQLFELGAALKFRM